MGYAALALSGFNLHTQWTAGDQTPKVLEEFLILALRLGYSFEMELKLVQMLSIIKICLVLLHLLLDCTQNGILSFKIKKAEICLNINYNLIVSATKKK